MRITAITKLKTKYRIDFDARDSIYVSENTIINFSLIKKMEISHEDIDKILSLEQTEAAFSKSLHYISYGMRTEKEIKDYLLKNKFDSNHIEKAIKNLKEINYIDDKLYAEMYIKDSFHINKKGPEYIKKKLLQKGINEYFIDEKISKICLKEICIDNVYYIIEKEFNKKQDSKHKKIQKITAKLYTNGYSFDIINQAFKIFFDHNDFADDASIIEKYYEKAYKTYVKKYDDEYKLKQKIIEKLMRDGFSYSDIKDYLSKIN